MTEHWEEILLFYNLVETSLNRHNWCGISKIQLNFERKIQVKTFVMLHAKKCDQLSLLL